MRSILMAAALLVSTSSFLSAQSTVHLFPLFVDGKAADGSLYKSTLLVTPSSDTQIPTCGFDLYGMSATFPGTIRSSSFNLSLLPGTALAEQTSGAQPLAIGYGILTCDSYVSANVLYSLYSTTGTKLGEATAFGTSFESSRWRLIADQREGAQLGLAVANGTGVTQVYDLTFVMGGLAWFGSFIVPARQSGTRFLSEIMNLPSDAAGLLTIRSRNLSDFSVMGLRFTGNTLTTIPAN